MHFKSKPARFKPLPAALLSGVLAAYALTCAAFIACALALTYTGLRETSVPLVVTVVCAVSVVLAGFDAGRAAESRGWLWGVAAGGIYAAILFLLLFIVAKSFTVDMRKVTLLVISLCGGGLGGILGIQRR